MKSINGVCFLCCKQKALTEEHIIPQALGGKLTACIYCKDCNDNMGSHIDSELGKRLGYFATALQVSRHMGENQPYNVSVVNDGTELTFNGKAFKRKKPIVKIEKDGNKVKSIDIKARTERELEKITSEIKKKYKLNVEVDKIFEEHPGPTDTVMDLVFDNSPIRRSIAKIAYGLICIKLPPTHVLSPSFDEIRNYIRLGSETHLATANFASTEFMTDNVRPLHKIHISLNRGKNLVVGFICILGTFRYTVLLSRDFRSPLAWPGLDYTFDPVASKETYGNPNFRAPALDINEILSPKHSKELVLAELAKGHKILENYIEGPRFLKIETEH